MSCTICECDTDINNIVVKCDPLCTCCTRDLINYCVCVEEDKHIFCYQCTCEKTHYIPLTFEQIEELCPKLFTKETENIYYLPTCAGCKNLPESIIRERLDKINKSLSGLSAHGSMSEEVVNEAFEEQLFIQKCRKHSKCVYVDISTKKIHIGLEDSFGKYCEKVKKEPCFHGIYQPPSE